MNHFHIAWSISTSIQIFSPIHSYHLSTIPVLVLSGADFNTPAILFNTSALVTGLWLVATRARTNKRKWSLKNWKNQAKLNTIAEDFYLKKFVYIQGSPALCRPFFPNKQIFLTPQSTWAREEELFLNNNSAFRYRNSTKFWIIVIQMFSLFVHSTNLKITITNLNSKFCVLLLPS